MRPDQRQDLRLRAVTVAFVALLVATGCQASASPTVAPTAAVRPSSPAVVSIVQPTSGSRITGNTLHVVLALTGARIVGAATTTITPDTGHVHLYVNNVLVSMNYGLEQDFPVGVGSVVPGPGTYVLKAEFVAADHAPFNPRDWSSEVYFIVP